MTSGAAGRYATALFELAVESKKLPAIEKDLTALGAMFADSDDLTALVKSPLYSREDQASAMGAIAKAAKLSPITKNFLDLMAAKRRLAVLPEAIKGFAALAAEKRGEINAEAITPQALSAAQKKTLTAAIKKAVGQDVKLTVSVDESIIGGLIVKVGSQMIDTSISSRLSGLQTALKDY